MPKESSLSGKKTLTLAAIQSTHTSTACRVVDLQVQAHAPIQACSSNEKVCSLTLASSSKLLFGRNWLTTSTSCHPSCGTGLLSRADWKGDSANALRAGDGSCTCVASSQDGIVDCRCYLSIFSQIGLALPFMYVFHLSDALMIVSGHSIEAFERSGNFPNPGQRLTS